MAYQDDCNGLMAGVAGMNIQDQPVPSAPPPSSMPPQPAPPIEVPPPYNPSMDKRAVLQQQVSLPNVGYGQPPDPRRSQLYSQPPPYSPTQQYTTLPRPQTGPWGQRSSCPDTSIAYMSLPRQMPPGSTWGVATPQPQGYPQQQAYHGGQPQSMYGVPPQPVYGGQGYPAYRSQAPAPSVRYVSPCRPNGYNIMDLFHKGNLLHLIPETSSNRSPIRTDWGKVVGGGSFSNQDTLFVVEEPRANPNDGVISLRNVANSSRYIAMSAKGDVKARNGFNEKCELHVRPVGSIESRVVCLESVAQPGKFVGMLPNGSTINSNTLVPSSKEAQFRVRAHGILNMYTSNMPLKAYGRISVLNQIADKCTVQLCNKVSKMYLAIDKKGRVTELQDNTDTHALFMVFDRGMGVVSLRSWKHPGYWLRVVNGELMGKGVPVWLEADFNIKESYDGTVCLEPFNSPGTLTTPPSSNCYDFTLTSVTVTQ